MPPERVRDIISSHQEQSTSLQAKVLHRHVSAQASLSKQLATVRLIRSRYLQRWRDYVHNLGDTLKRQLEEKADVLAGFDSEEAVLLETIESAKASVVSIAGKDMLLAAEASDMDISKEEAATEAVNIDRQKLQQQEQALLMAIDTMKEDADKEASEKETPCKRDGSRSPRRVGKNADVQSISSDTEKKPHFRAARS